MGANHYTKHIFFVQWLASNFKKILIQPFNSFKNSCGFFIYGIWILTEKFDFPQNNSDMYKLEKMSCLVELDGAKQLKLGQQLKLGLRSVEAKLCLSWVVTIIDYSVQI